MKHFSYINEVIFSIMTVTKRLHGKGFSVGLSSYDLHG